MSRNAICLVTFRFWILRRAGQEVQQIFFVYGGTTRAEERHLLIMAGSYDHRSGRVSRPQIVHDKLGVDDPHDNPSLALDDHGHLWVFISGRGRS